MSSPSDAAPGDAAGPVTEQDPPASSLGGPLHSAPPTGSPDSPGDAPSSSEEGERGGADAVDFREPDAVGFREPDAGDLPAVDLTPDDDVDPVVHALTTERDLYREMAQRVQADFENYRKRALAQSRDEADRATGRLAEALLPVLDATEAAYLRHPEEVGPLLNLLLGELRKLGLEALHLQDQPFDPNLADAVAHEAGVGGDIVVAEVLRSGYTWNGRPLRPAMVRTVDRDAGAPGTDD